MLQTRFMRTALSAVAVGLLSSMLLPQHSVAADPLPQYLVISIGDKGNESNLLFWKRLIQEHGIQVDGKPIGDRPVGHAEAFFDFSNDRYHPRTVFVDLDPNSKMMANANSMQPLFIQNHFVIGKESAGGNWAKGRYGEGQKLIGPLMDVIGEELKKTTNPGGIFIVDHYVGGSSSGFGSLLLKRLKKARPDLPIIQVGVLPSAKVNQSVVGPYNTVLSFNYLVADADLVLLIDNEALFNISVNSLGAESPTHSQLDRLTSSAMSLFTAQLRFGDVTGIGELKKALNCTDRLKFLQISIAPILKAGDASTSAISDIMEQVQKTTHLLSATSSNHGVTLGQVFISRGKVSAEHQVKAWKKFGNAWAGSASSSSTPLSAALVLHSTSVTDVFSRIFDQFSLMFKRKAFLNWYLKPGMKEGEFTAASSNFRNLIQEYSNLGGAKKAE
jgi:tubulin beta